ncbi:hypothetical protein [Chitinophaga pinensis]|uniref:Lipocalin-like domain-containing protein n=1 Tax=Chitinophaga pinensis (strain ATCC 43595 / DSM 2588 / LMG 13176 / NBRC 15968 / NCIMB 11800 / UQM 2034) TaxID=485918 RepID=A0A979GW55_CHIPD|nr:hypothetical protein [Chitinophaga pinensis]ACU63858.1 hypothetical protein Cpin_6454 [Chitinophaga pinensis DSM 2588]
MKNAVLFMAVAMTLAFIACKKDKNEHQVDDALLPKTVANLQGEWEAVSFLTVTGGPLRWEPVTEKDHITFSFNGLFVSTQMIYDTYQLNIIHPDSDSRDTLLNLYKASQPQAQIGNFIIHRLTKDTLFLDNTYCLDFCSTKYVRVK